MKICVIIPKGWKQRQLGEQQKTGDRVYTSAGWQHVIADTNYLYQTGDIAIRPATDFECVVDITPMLNQILEMPDELRRALLRSLSERVCFFCFESPAACDCSQRYQNLLESVRVFNDCL